MTVTHLTDTLVHPLWSTALRCLKQVQFPRAGLGTARSGGISRDNPRHSHEGPRSSLSSGRQSAALRRDASSTQSSGNDRRTRNLGSCLLRSGRRPRPPAACVSFHERTLPRGGRSAGREPILDFTRKRCGGGVKHGPRAVTSKKGAPRSEVAARWRSMGGCSASVQDAVEARNQHTDGRVDPNDGLAGGLRASGRLSRTSTEEESAAPRSRPSISGCSLSDCGYYFPRE